MRIAYLAAGAAGMVCGSCLRDNRVAATLRQLGRNVAFLPLYTPLTTDEPDAASDQPVFYGGLNLYLRQRSALFRALPALFRRWLDSRFILNRAMRWPGAADPQQLGALTVSVLEGNHGTQRAELEKLAAYLKTLHPAVIHLPNLPFVGIARELKRAIGANIVCTLSGEDIFLDRLAEPFRARCFELIARHGADVDAFVAVSRYYAEHASRHFALPRDKVHVVPMGVTVNDFIQAQPEDRPFTIGYLARICPEKGLANLADALVQLHRQGRHCRVQAAGYLAPADKPYLNHVLSTLHRAGLADRFTYHGTLTRRQKIDFFRPLHAFSVPTQYPEAKGLYIIEALAAGVPVVQPRHGSFPELIADTGGGLLYDLAPDDANANPLADAIARLMDDSVLRRKLAQSGRRTVHQSFNDRVMAEKTWMIYERLNAKTHAN